MTRLLTIAAASSWPGLALACSVCGSATEQNKWAFFGTTWFLTFVPLLAIGGGVWWVWRRVKAHAAELDEARG